MSHNRFVEWTHNGGPRGRHTSMLSAPSRPIHSRRLGCKMTCDLTPEQRIAAALSQPICFGVLSDLAIAFKSEGMSQSTMHALFDSYRAKHHADKDESVYNAILVTMDLVTGFCGPDQRLFEKVYPT